MKKIIFIFSIILNLIFFSFIILFFLKIEITEDDSKIDNKINKTYTKINFDSINRLNNVKLLNIDPNVFLKKTNIMSQNRNCVIIYWASWCKYCPAMLSVIEKLKNDKTLNFSCLTIATDKPNKNSTNRVLEKIAKLNLKGEVYNVSENINLSINNSESIYKYLPVNNNFDENPGFPHLIILEKGKIIYEQTGFDAVYGASKFINFLK